MVIAAIGAGAAVAGAGANVAGALGASSQASGASQESAALQAQQQQINQANQGTFIGLGQQAAYYQGAALQSGQLGAPMDLSQMPTSAGAPSAFAGMDLSGMPNWSQVPQFNWNPATAGGQPSSANVPQFNWDPTQAGLAATPGYQFTQQQGLQATQNAAAAQGLGVSGSALKGAANYATGLASSTYNQQLQNAIGVYGQQLQGYNTGLNTYNSQFTNALNQYQQQLAGFTTGAGQFQNQFNDYWSNAQNQYNQQLSSYQAGNAQYQNQFNDYWANQTNRYNQLAGLTGLGESAAAGAGYSGQAAAAGVGNAVAQAGAQQAAGTMGAGNALSGLANNPYVNQLIQNAGTSSSSPPANPSTQQFGDTWDLSGGSALAPSVTGTGSTLG